MTAMATTVIRIVAVGFATNGLNAAKNTPHTAVGWMIRNRAAGLLATGLTGSNAATGTPADFVDIIKLEFDVMVTGSTESSHTGPA